MSIRGYAMAAGLICLGAVGGCGNKTPSGVLPPVPTTTAAASAVVIQAATNAPQSGSAAATSAAPTTSVVGSTAAVATGPAGGLTVGPHGELYSPAAAKAKATADLAAVVLPPGAVLQSSPLPTLLTQTSEDMGTPEFAAVNQWWQVPGAVTDLSAFFTSHPPTGFTAGDSSGGAGAHPETTLDFDPADAANSPETLFGLSFAQDGDHVDLRAEVQVVWLPTRTAIETIPATVKVASVVYQGPTTLPHNAKPAPPLHRTLTGAGLAQLVRTLNALDTTPPEQHSCPPPTGELMTMRMSYAGRKVVFTTTLGGCEGTGVTANGIPQPALSTADDVDSVIHTVLGVTAAEDPFLQK